MKSKRRREVVLGNNRVSCPCCGYALVVGATVRLKATREIGQMPLMDDDQASSVVQGLAAEEGGRHG